MNQHALKHMQVIQATGTTVARTRFELMDVPPVHDKDMQTPGFYIAACGINTSARKPWRGCGVQRSYDGGLSYPDMIAVVSRESAIGHVVTAGEGALMVKMMNDVPLLSASEASLDSGRNLAVLGNDVIQFTTATLLSIRTYLISGLVADARGANRGKRIVRGKVGDRFVPVASGTWVRKSINESLLGKTFDYIAQTSNSSQALATRAKFACNATWWKRKG